MAYTHKKPTDFEREYILGPDGVFYSREVITTPIVNQHMLVDRCKFKEELIVQDNLNRFEIKDTDTSRSVQMTYANGYYEGFYKNNQLAKHIFVPITSFPFPKANIIHVQEEATANPSYNYKLHPRASGQLTEGVIQTPMTPYYSSPYYKMFLFFSVTQSSNSISSNSFSVSAPFLFAVNKETKEPAVLNLPNIFETGKICTGDDYGSLAGAKHIRAVVEKVTKELFTSPANTDLFPPSSQYSKHLMYNEMGVLGNAEKEDSKIKDSGFFTPCSRSQIVDFCSTDACNSTTN